MPGVFMSECGRTCLGSCETEDRAIMSRTIRDEAKTQKHNISCLTLGTWGNFRQVQIELCRECHTLAIMLSTDARRPQVLQWRTGCEISDRVGNAVLIITHRCEYVAVRRPTALGIQHNDRTHDSMELDNGQEFYPGYQGYNEFFLGQGQDGSIGFLPPSQGTPPLTLDPSMPPPGLGQEGQFLPGDILPPASTPEPMPLHGHDGSFIPRSIPGTPFSQSLSQSLSHHHPEMSEAW